GLTANQTQSGCEHQRRAGKELGACQHRGLLSGLQVRTGQSRTGPHRGGRTSATLRPPSLTRALTRDEISVFKAKRLDLGQQRITPTSLSRACDNTPEGLALALFFLDVGGSATFAQLLGRAFGIGLN